MLCDLLASPQLTSPVIHVAGTNGKTSVARIIETLLRTMGLRTGLMTSPALRDLTERIEIDGEPVSTQRFVDVYRQVEPYLEMVDSASVSEGGPPMTMFEVITGLGYALFADSPVDVAVVEAGMGGRWDATNVNAADVAVITPIGMDHTDYLGETLAEIAAEKAGIIKPGARVVLAHQQPEALAVLVQAADDAGASVLLPGTDYEVISRGLAVGGQVVTMRVADHVYEEVFLNLHGRHQADNAALAVAAVRALLGRNPEPDLVTEAFAQVHSPGRLEVIGRHPLTLADAAHNPHGMQALCLAVAESFTYDRLVAVLAIMGDKDIDAMLSSLAQIVDEVVVTANDSPRCLPAPDLAQAASGYWSADAVHQVGDLSEAMEFARTLAGPQGCVVATGSVVTAGMARGWARS
ncbi:MAG: bifunctional folylpolyglutamate synthase/dihydrofolate synthase [Actinobacteria bacterium]|nr:bifunctional folylpolyglutamate synthase/dihydrofolate synthase [Actinomycetota bacterium]